MPLTDNWFQSHTPVYLGGILVFLGALLTAHPTLLFLLIEGASATRELQPTAPLLALAGGQALIARHCAACDYSPGRALFGLLALFFLFDAGFNLL